MKGVSLMKYLYKISFVSLCILLFSLSVIYATKGTDSLEADKSYQIQPTSISDVTYTVFIWTGKSIIPKYFPQFEFEAGDILKVTSVSSEISELTGTWTETDFGIFTHFTARVEVSETTTTTTADSTTKNTAVPQSAEPKAAFMINLWGLSFDFTPPEPFNVIAFNILIGAGSYLGADVIFSGFAGTTDVPEFGSINPSEGNQGEQLLDVEITCKNTEFITDGVDNITFIPPDDITITNITVKDDTHVEFDLEIGFTAVTGVRPVSITTGGETYTSESGKGFTINESTASSTTTTSAP